MQTLMVSQDYGASQAQPPDLGSALYPTTTTSLSLTAADPRDCCILRIFSLTSLSVTDRVRRARSLGSSASISCSRVFQLQGCHWMEDEAFALLLLYNVETTLRPPKGQGCLQGWAAMYPALSSHLSFFIRHPKLLWGLKQVNYGGDYAFYLSSSFTQKARTASLSCPVFRASLASIQSCGSAKMPGSRAPEKGGSLRLGLTGSLV